jgi:hypothetical protein
MTEREKDRARVRNCKANGDLIYSRAASEYDR